MILHKYGCGWTPQGDIPMGSPRKQGPLQLRNLSSCTVQYLPHLWIHFSIDKGTDTRSSTVCCVICGNHGSPLSAFFVLLQELALLGWKFHCLGCSKCSWCLLLGSLLLAWACLIIFCKVRCRRFQALLCTGAMGSQQQGVQHIHEVALTNRNRYAKIRLLFFLHHFSQCQALEGQCQYGNACIDGKTLWRHILTCGNTECLYPRCVASKMLLKHEQNCNDKDCPICMLYRGYRSSSIVVLHKFHQELAQQQLNLEAARSRVETARSNVEAARSNMEATRSNLEAAFLQNLAQQESTLEYAQSGFTQG